MPFGPSNAGERLAPLDQEHPDAALLYPTIGLLWEVELTDPELSFACCREMQTVARSLLAMLDKDRAA